MLGLTLQLLCAAIATSFLSQVRAPVPASSAMSGVVRDAVTGAPIRQARVCRGRGGARPGGARCQFADDRGRFVLLDVPAGTYRLTATRPGYAMAWYGGSSPKELSIAAGEWFRTAEIEMVPLGSISGIVSDEAGEPVAGAPVQALMPFQLAGHPHVAAGPRAVTDDRGFYRLSGLTPGRYVVMVPSVSQSVPANATAFAALGAARGALIDGGRALVVGSYVLPPPAAGGRRLAYPHAFHPNASRIDQAASIDVEGGTERGSVEIRLQPVLAVRVTGRLSEPPPNLDGVVVRLIPVGLEYLTFGAEAATAAVGLDGTFTFINVPAGEYVVAADDAAGFVLRDPALDSAAQSERAWGEEPRSGQVGRPSTPGLGARAPGSSFLADVKTVSPGSPYATVTVTSYPSASFADQRARYGRVRVTVGDVDVTDLVVPRVRPVTVRARLVIEDVRGNAGNGILQFSPADGNPMQGGATRILGPDEWRAVDRVPLELPNLLPGRYVFTLTPAGGATRLSLKSIVADGLDVTRGAVEVTGSDDVDVVITLTGRVIRVSGSVRNPTGARPPEATVLAFPTDRTLWSNQGVSPTWIRAGRVSDRGDFAVDGLRAGEYFLAAIDPSVVREWRDVTFLDRLARQATRITVDWGEHPRVDLRVVDIR